jgi:hypothetical protein
MELTKLHFHGLDSSRADKARQLGFVEMSLPTTTVQPTCQSTLPQTEDCLMQNSPLDVLLDPIYSF